MQDLDFAPVGRVEQVLTSIALDDLVAVFSQASGQYMLLIYNTATCPAITIDNCEVIPLDELREADLEPYDGLLVGISALDVIRDDLLTKGPGFCPLERIILKLKPPPTLHSTLRNLARYLVAFLDNLSDLDSVRRQRAEIKIVQLALPALLDERGAEGLVAVLPGSELARFVEGQGGEWLDIADDLSVPSLPHGDGWIVALEELCWFNPHINPDDEHFIELRNELRQAGYIEALRWTCRTLAGRCTEAAIDRPELWRPAWELMTEAWLMGEDVEELVAFFPHTDFEHFARTGEGLRVYRTLAAEAASIMPGPRCAMANLEQQSIPTKFQRYKFSVIPLDVLLTNATGKEEQADLGWLLWKAGYEAQFTRTLLLLARDELEGGGGDRVWSQKILSDLARRAMLLISTGDPWVLRQGRYAQLASSAYEILRSALQRHAEVDRKAWRHYFEGLIHWYGCYNQEDKQEIEQSLHQMMHSLRMFLRDSRDRVDELTSRYRQIAEQLIDVAEAALYPFAAVKPEQKDHRRPDYRYQWRKALAKPIELEVYPPYLSPIFDRVIGYLMHLREERQQILMYEHDVDVLRRKLIEILHNTQRQRKLIFAPPHEMVVLRFICDSETSVVEERLRELGTTRLAIIPVSDRVEHLREVRLTFEVRNIGRVETKNAELVLEPNLTFELKDHSSVREFPHLAPGESQRFSYQVRAVHTSEAPFEPSYSELEPQVLRFTVEPLDPSASGLDRRDEATREMRRLVKLFGPDALHWFDERSEEWRSSGSGANLRYGAFFGNTYDRDGLAGSKVYYETRPHQMRGLPRALSSIVSTALHLLPSLAPVFTTISCRRESGGQRVTFHHRGPLRLADLEPLLEALGMQHQLAGMMQTMGLALGGRFELPERSVLIAVGQTPEGPEVEVYALLGAIPDVPRNFLDLLAMGMTERPRELDAMLRWLNAFTPESGDWPGNFSVLSVRMTPGAAPRVSLYLRPIEFEVSQQIADGQPAAV